MKDIKWGEYACPGIYIIYLSDIHFYIGQARNCRKRWTKHLAGLKRRGHGSRWISNIYNKYQMFSPQLLERCLNNDKELNEREQYWLDLFWGTRGCVNSNKTATGKNKTLTQKQKDHLRNINLGKKHSEETKKKVSLAGKGRKHTEETKAKMKEFSQKRAKDEFYLSKLSLAQIGKTPLSEEEIKNIVNISKTHCSNNFLGKIRQATMNGEEIAVWNSINEIINKLKVKRVSLKRALSKERQSFMSFRWDFLGPKKTCF